MHLTKFCDRIPHNLQNIVSFGGRNTMQVSSSAQAESIFSIDEKSLSSFDLKEFEDRMRNRIHVVKNRHLSHSDASKTTEKLINSQLTKN